MATKKSDTKKKDRILIIVESPNKRITISQLLKGTDYEGAVVMASVGHISEIKDGKKSGSYHNTGIYPSNNFEADYAVSSDKKEVVDKLKEQVQLADIVYVCSDPDREGEAIAWSLVKFLKIPKTKCKRATFHEITKNAVLNALNNPRDIDDDLVEAAHARQKLDKLMGYRLSPVAKRFVGAKSVGRCQSAGLKLVADREKEIQNFVPETYYDVFLRFAKNMNQYKAKYVGTEKKSVNKITDKKVAEKISADCKGKTYSICDIETKEKISNPKPPFTTSTFQQEVASKLGMSVKKSMEVAQHLFEGIEVNGEHLALITYLRTDSPEISPDFQPEIEKFIKKTYGEKYYAPMKKAKKSDTAQDGHEALRVVNLEMTPEKLSKYIKDTHLLKVYDIIYKRTIASMMAPAVYNETIYLIENGTHRFAFASQEIKFDGYKKLYTYKDDAEDDEVTKDTFKLKEKLEETSLECTEKKTNPPSRYKEATFIKKLEDTSIGRPSTYATIVSTILDKTRGYCTLESGTIIPTDKGMKLAEFLDTKFSDLINLNYTRDLEENLDRIATHKMTEVEFLNSFYNVLEKTAKSVKTSDAPKKEYVVSDEVCPNCGAKMYLRTNTRNGQKFWGCSKFPKCKTIIQYEENN